MLRSEFRFRLDHWPQRLAAVVLGEAFLGFLAIIAVALTLFPMLFSVGAVASAAIDTAQWAIIGWFAVEYLVAFGSAPAKAAFLRNPWRLIDLATILIPLASLLPSVSGALRSSPVLRLVRLVRLATLGVRASGVVVRDRARQHVGTAPRGPAQVTLVADMPVYVPAPAGWEALLRWLGTRGEEWFHVSNPSADELRQIATAAALPPSYLETHLLNATHPHLAVSRGCAGLFLWLPEFDPATGQTDRHAVLFVFWAKGLLSLSRRSAHAVERLEPPSDELSDAPASFPLRMIALMVQRVVRQNETLVGRFEQELRALEDVPVRESRPEFFERTFRLKKELSAAQADLWRLKAVLADLATAQASLPGGSETTTELFGRLRASVEYLYETIVNTREEVLSVIELHLNVVSFDMNRVMRVLAVVSVLGLIPAVIGGLFGMNLVDNPWPFTLPQVAFVICFGMLVGLYFFFVKGWLR